MGKDSEILAWIENVFEFRFPEEELAVCALTHKSFANESINDVSHNERLEFLGDAVLSLIVCSSLFSQEPILDEGGMTRARAEIVSEASLAVIARRIGLGDRLRLGRGEELTGGREKDSLLADCVEAILGAIFLCGGYTEVERVVCRLFQKELADAALRKSDLDSKTELQELLQARYGKLPEYSLVDVQGPDHARHYHIAVRFAGEIIGEGKGRSKKKAEQVAATAALQKLQDL